MGTGNMKYWNELNALENEIIRLDSLKSLMTVVTNGVESTARPEDIENTLWHILGSIEDIVDKQYEHFQNLFDMVREEDEVSPVLATNDYVAPSAESNELDKVMRSWAQQ